MPLIRLVDFLRIIAVSAPLCAATASLAGGAQGEDVHFCEYEVIIAPFEQCCGCFGPPNNTGHGINGHGHVAGYFEDCEDTDTFAFLWMGGPDIITLELPWEGRRSWAFDINDARQVAGTIEISDVGRRAFFFDGKRFFDLGTLAGGNYSESRAVNESGQITGIWGNMVTGDPTGSDAFFWEDGIMTGLGPILGTDRSAGLDINDRGWITGWMGTSITAPHAFIWDGTNVIELSTPLEILGSTGAAINERGDVAGWIQFEHSTGTLLVNAALWLSDGSFANLGRLPDHHYCRARALNERGEVVGICHIPGVQAFMWRGGVMVELGSLVPDLEEPLGTAYAINASGEITGGLRGGGTFIMRPIDPPLTDLTGDCRTGADDLHIVLAGWGEPGLADFDGSGAVDLADLLLLLHHWD